MNWWVSGRPPSGVVSQTDLERKVNKDSKCHVLLTETFIQKFKVRDSVVGLEAYFGNQVNDDDALNISKFEDSKHDLVDVNDAFSILGLFLSFHDRETKRNDKVGPAPKCKITAKRHYAELGWAIAEVAICKVRGVEGQENGVGKELARRETNRLRSRGIG